MTAHPSPSVDPPRRGRRALVVLAVAVALVLVAAIGAVLVSQRDGGHSCRPGADLVPRCGPWIGVVAPAPTVADLDQTEQAMAGPADLVYSFHDINDVIPSSYDEAVLARGQILHLDIDARDYASADPTTVTWREIADGAYDSSLAAQARGVAHLGVPVFLTFDHEPDQPARSAVGSPADYVAAWRHVHQVFESNGATNAVWVWVVMGIPQTYASSLAFWPGNDVVDWISWEAYDVAGCDVGPVDPGRFHSFEAATLGYYDYLHAHGSAAGIDVGKPMMLSESGTVPIPGTSSPTHTWYDGAPQLLRTHPQIKAVTMWNHLGSSPGCDFRFSTDPELSASVHRLLDAGARSFP